jgi:hypothetical protein
MRWTKVNEEEFYNFLKDKNYRVAQGVWFHATFYIDAETKERIAFKETSGYNMDTIYEIKRNPLKTNNL